MCVYLEGGGRRINLEDFSDENEELIGQHFYLLSFEAVK